MNLDSFWAIIDAQLQALRTAKGVDDVMSVLSTEGRHADAGFFGGSGGDEGVDEALLTAGWSYLWCEASYHWAMRAPDGTVLTYIEGDVLRHNQPPLPHEEPSTAPTLVCGHAECVVGLPCKREAPEVWR